MHLICIIIIITYIFESHYTRQILLAIHKTIGVFSTWQMVSYPNS